MYYQYFNLEKKPFQINSDNEFLWLSKKHTVALDSLTRGMAKEQGLLVLTGDVGTGKTTLLNEIIHTLDRETLVVKISDPGFEMSHLFLTIAQTLGFEDHYQKGQKFSSAFIPFLKTAEAEGKNVIVIVDEAQRIPERFLKEIASWTKFGFNQVLTVILAGQLEFRNILRSTLGPAWQNCISVHAFLEPLDEKETKTYINKRLEMAGTTRKIFLISAISEIHIYSKGIPRMINTSCDQALITAFGKNIKIVDAPTAKQATGQLDLPTIPPKKEKKDHHPKSKTSCNNRPWFQEKTMAGLAVATCLCILTGYLFNTQYLPSAMENPLAALPVKTKSPANISQKSSLPAATKYDTKDTEPTLSPTIHPIVPISQSPDYQPLEDQTLEDQTAEDQNIGLGYTPAPFSEKGKSSSPVLMKNIGEISRTVKAVKDTPKDMDWFINEVFLFKEQTIAVTESPADSKTTTGMGQLSGTAPPEPVAPARNNHMTVSPDSPKEPEPDAIIDWLLKNRNIK